MSGSTPRGLAWSVVDTFGALTRREVSPAGRPAPKIRKRKETFATAGRLRHLGARAETVVVSLLAIWRGATAQQRGQRHSRARGSRFRGGQSSVRIPAGGRPVPRNHSLPATCFACMARSEWRMYPASEWRCCPLPCRGGGHAFACSHSQSLALWFSVATADGS